MHLRFTHAQIVEAAMVTAQGIRSRLTTLETGDAPENAEIAYLGSRIKELRELTRQLNHNDEKDRVRQLVHIRHMLHKRIRALAEGNNMHADVIVPHDEAEADESHQQKEPQSPRTMAPKENEPI